MEACRDRGWMCDADTGLPLTEKPVQFDHVQLEVVNETVDIEEMAHQSHQAVAYSAQIQYIFRALNLKSNCNKSKTMLS